MSLIKKDEAISKDIIFRLFSLHESFSKVVTSERKLSEHYTVSRNTIRKALNILINMGILTNNSKGYNLLPTKEDYDTTDALLKFESNHIANQILQIEDTESNKEISDKISQPLGTKIKIITYLRRNLQGIPLSFDTVIVPLEKLTGDIWKLNNTSVIKLICKQNNTTLPKEYQEISLHHANSYESKLLNIKDGMNTVLRESLFSSEDNTIFTYLHSIKRIEKCLITQPNKKIYDKVGGFIE